jgi:hypothetical protein
MSRINHRISDVALNSIRISIAGILFLACTVQTFAAPVEESEPADAVEAIKPLNRKAKTPWSPLFDGKTLKDWKITNFGGQGEVKVDKGRIILGVGADMTGIHTSRKMPRLNYEVELDAMRVDGSDFFCGLTFPVGKKPCSLIIGGWGGGVCGLSSIDGMDASENETTTYRSFKKGIWYRVRLRVTGEDIQVWLAGKQIVYQKITGRKITIRQEVALSKPFGFSTWQTTGALRNVRIRKLAASESAALKPVKKSKSKKK